MTVAFAAENTLGKLSKWLRILGFDTICSSGGQQLDFFLAASSERVLLTRTRSMARQIRSDRLLFVRSDEPRQQLMEVIRNLHIQPEDVRPFTRCVDCNHPIEPVEKRLIRNQVPDFVYEVHEQFQRCRQCRKVFWPGSHTTRALEVIRGLFDAAVPNTDETKGKR